MPVTRKNVEFAKQIAYDREGDRYVYGGNWNPFDRTVGTDCSGAVTDELDAAINGTAMEWTRHGLSTESYRLAHDPNNGPFGTRRVSHPNQFPADAAVKIALAHYGGGADSHMWCEVDGLRVESNGRDGTVLGKNARDVNDTSYANDWWYLPGPVLEDGTPLVHQPSGSDPAPAGEPKDTLFADVSEFQTPVTDAYPYAWLSIRSNDGTHRDKNFAANYAWCKKAADDGRLKGFIVYFYWRPGSGDLDTHMAMVNEEGGPHRKMVVMIDLESGGNPGGDHSQEVNDEYFRLGKWLGDGRRVIGYANLSDERTMWQFKPEHVPMILAGYGSNPNDPTVFKIAHQYTDGQGYGGGLPEGAPPWAHCDMNSADGFSPTQLAQALGVDTATGDDFMAQISDNDAQILIQAAKKQLAMWDNDDLTKRHGWASRSIYRTSDDPVDDSEGMNLNVDGSLHEFSTEWRALTYGDPEAIQMIKATADGTGPGAKHPDGTPDDRAVRHAQLVLSQLQSKSKVSKKMVPSPGSPETRS
jgi:hypothetical protein